MEMTGPQKISIIMPTYNRAAYIVDTIESIRKQTYSNWELIIIDDGSDDDTEKIINGLSDERICFYKAGRIGIGGKIKNIGLEKASGQLIAFIDSDDLWPPTKLEQQVLALQHYPEAGFSLTGGYNFLQPGIPADHFYKQQEGQRYGNILHALFRSEVAAFIQTLVLRKECLELAGHFKEQKSFSDVDFIISLAQHYKAVILYEPLLFRRLHDQNYIHGNWQKSCLEGIGIIHYYKHLIPAGLARNALFRLYINYGEKCLQHRQNRNAIIQFLHAWRYRPFSRVPLKKIAKAGLRWIKILPAGK